MRWILLMTYAIFSIPLLACMHTSPSSSAALCERLGGRVERLTSGSGQIGLCVFGERAGIEVGTLSRFKSGEKVVAVQAFLNPASLPGNPSEGGVAIPNPASANCVKLGGKSEIVEGPGGGQLGLCVFPDRSMIEEWTLFRGSSAEENAALVQALR